MIFFYEYVMIDDNKFFKETKKNGLMNLILNTDYSDEDEVWNLALELEHISIVLRRNILRCDYDDI